MRLPNFLMPPLMSNHGNYIVSLGKLCRWLGEQAAELGVEIYPGFAAAEVLYDEEGAVAGVATGDMGVGRDGKPNDDFVRGMELRGKYTFIAEGARGSLSKQLITAVRPRRGPRAAEVRHRPQGAVGGRARASTSPAWCSTRSAGRSTIAPAAARSSTTTATTWCRSASCCTSTTRTRISSPLRRVPALQDASRHPRHLRGRQAHRLRRARHHRGRLAVDARSWRFPAARCSAARPAS